MSAVHITCHVVVSMLVVPLLTFAQTPSVSSPQQVTVDGATTHEYKSVGGSQLRLHVFGTDGPDIVAQKPAIVFFFGGGWKAGSVTQFVPQARHFAHRGTVAVVADYRVFSRHGMSPFEAMADAKSAVRWVRAHSAQLGVDS
jgi:acetyl esterase/lipase